MNIVSTASSKHYAWGEACDGWHLVQREDLSIIQERVPGGGAERMHRHEHSRQFFYILKGSAVIQVAGSIFQLKEGQGLEIPPGIPHQFRNESGEEVLFLVVSMPPSHGDRLNLESQS